MKLSKEQQNTFIMIATILIVSLITFIAIFNIIWGIVAQPINDAVSSISYFLKTQNVDYNFEVPAASNSNTQQESTVQQENTQPVAQEPAQQNQTQQNNRTSPTAQDSTSENTELPVDQEVKAVDNRVVDYNFAIPALNTNNATINFQSFPDAIISDAILAGYGSGSDTPQVNLQIVIPKIGINSPVMQGLGANDLLEKGFWTYPGSYELGKGEVVMLCHRRYFGPYDPRGCWFLDKVAKGDEIIMKYADVSLSYEIVGVNVFEGDDPLIYSISDTDDYIKIVTCTPLYSNTHRLVVLAKRTK